MTKPDEIASFSQFSVVSHMKFGSLGVDAIGDDDDLSHVYHI